MPAVEGLLHVPGLVQIDNDKESSAHKKQIHIFQFTRPGFLLCYFSSETSAGLLTYTHKFIYTFKFKLKIFHSLNQAQQ